MAKSERYSFGVRTQFVFEVPTTGECFENKQHSFLYDNLIMAIFRNTKKDEDDQNSIFLAAFRERKVLRYINILRLDAWKMQRNS